MTINMVKAERKQERLDELMKEMEYDFRKQLGEFMEENHIEIENVDFDGEEYKAVAYGRNCIDIFYYEYGEWTWALSKDL